MKPLKNNWRKKTALKMKSDIEIKAKPTHEVMVHSDGSSAFQGTGQQCADWMYLHKGNGYYMRPAIFERVA